MLNAPSITTVTAAILTMTTDQRLLNAEESLKEKHISIINGMSQTELKQFRKYEYKKTFMSEMGDLLHDFRKKQYDQTAQCVVKVSKGAKIRNRYNQVPHLTQDTNGKVTNSQKTPQTRAKRSALSQQVTTKHI